ncbi:MAG: hypothetical protein ACTSWN_12825 [Promethearchaeota archaeon]
MRNNPRKIKNGKAKQESKNSGEKSRPKARRPKTPTHWISFATKDEKDLIRSEVNMFGVLDEAWNALVVRPDCHLYTYKKGSIWSAHLFPRDAKDRLKVLMGNPGLIHFGLYIGMLKKNQFNISLEGASELVRNGGLSRNFVKLDADGTKSTLYGQDIKKKYVVRVSDEGIFHDRRICLVLDKSGNLIGIGKVKVSDPFLESSEPDDPVIKIIADKGLYLRAQDYL